MKHLRTLIENAYKALEEEEQASAEVPEGSHLNDKVGKGVPLPHHLHQSCINALKKGYEADYSVMAAKGDMGQKQHEASAAYYDAFHALKAAGFTRLAAKMLKMSHRHRSSAVDR